jgi:hypothetical protein
MVSFDELVSQYIAKPENYFSGFMGYSFRIYSI